MIKCLINSIYSNNLIFKNTSNNFTFKNQNSSACQVFPANDSFELNSSQITINDLPNEVLFIIFKNLSLVDLGCQLALVSRRFSECASEIMNTQMQLPKEQCENIFHRVLNKNKQELSLHVFKQPLMKKSLTDKDMFQLMVTQNQFSLINAIEFTEDVWTKENWMPAFEDACLNENVDLVFHYLNVFFKTLKLEWTKAHGEILCKLVRENKQTIVRLLLKIPQINPFIDYSHHQNQSFYMTCKKGDVETLKLYTASPFFEPVKVALEAINQAASHKKQEVVEYLLENSIIRQFITNDQSTTDYCNARMINMGWFHLLNV